MINKPIRISKRNEFSNGFTVGDRYLTYYIHIQLMRLYDYFSNIGKIDNFLKN